MAQIIGTSHFRSEDDAVRYYWSYGLDRRDVARKIREGEISIGQPALRDGETAILIDNGTRYAIYA